jgi:hypothetical protein
MNLFFYLVVGICCLSCFSSKKASGFKSVLSKELWDLHFFKAKKDSIDGKEIRYYPSLNLKEVGKRDDFALFINEKEIFKKDYDKYNNYSVQIFDTSFLLIAYYKGDFGAAGPETFNRDTMIIIDLKTGLKKMTHLPNTYLTISPIYLLYAYGQTNAKESGWMHAIDSIDLLNNKLILINRRLEKLVIPTHDF